MKKKIIYVSAIALIDWEQKVLLSLRSKSKPLSNYWEFPGGKIKQNENPDEAIIRELNEELNIVVQKNFLRPLTFTLYDYKNFEVVIFFYLSRNWSGTPLSNEKQKILWVKLDQIKNYKMLPANQKLILMLPLILGKFSNLNIFLL